jgi:succinyl-CoA synthetase beta subunit
MALLDYIEAKNLLKKYGIESIESRYVSSAAEAIRFAKGKPIVLKGISEKALHKSKAGLVKLRLSSPKEITTAFSEIKNKSQKLAPYKILAQKMSNGGIEAIIGGRTDPQFGKLILIGLGGIYVEVFRDFSLRICPIKSVDAHDMLDQLKSKSIVTYQGKNEKMVTELLLKASKLLTENDSIKELDLNPVIVRENGYDIVDIRILE